MPVELTVVIPVWDQHTHLLPRCLQAIHREPIAIDLVLVNNASSLPLHVPPAAREITLANRHTIGAARNAALAHITTPFVVFADADDEIAPGSLTRGLSLLASRPEAAGVVGRSIVDEHGRYRRGRTPRTPYRLASRWTPALAPLFWLTAFQCSITSTVLRTDSVRDAGGFADTDIGEDWQLAARLARRGHLICLDEPVRIYHRHSNAARNARSQQPKREIRRSICADCIRDPHAPRLQRVLASVLLSR
jgi:cellulose synthase/poly-beta-1,6-N-acetylglucosamine synthase-like glycosyltransferase